MKTVIMAGGKGTRIQAAASGVPKPLVAVAGKPVLEREIECLREQGFCDLILTVSFLSEQIMSYFGDGSTFGVHIDYFVEEQPLGNAGALFALQGQLTEDFLLLNADTVLSVDFSRFAEYHKKRKGLVTLFTHPNDHPYDSGLILANKEKMVHTWITKEAAHPRWYQNRVNAGIHMISPEIFRESEITKILDEKKKDGKTYKVDLDREILRPLCTTGRVYCYDSPEYVKDLGTPERLAEVCEDYRRGIVDAKCLKKEQRAIFLDRDGTLNRYVGFLREEEDFHLLDGVSEAVRAINKSGYLAIVVTNQPVIARGEVTEEQLYTIHCKMETLLGNGGAYLDAIYYCPHHQDKGFDGEVPELKIDCDCRKPKPGLLIRAAEEFHIDLENSWMIGDQESDIMAGKRAKCHTALIGESNFGQDISGDSLLSLIHRILG